MRTAPAASNNLRSYITGLGEAGYALTLVIDGDLPGAEIETLLPLCHSLILDGGRGFAAYRQASLLLLQEPGLTAVDQLLYADDSVFVRPSALRPLLAQINERKNDYLGAGEVFYRRHHLTGWFFTVPRFLLLSDAFAAFWQQPTSPTADIAFTEAMLRAGGTPRALYDGNTLAARLAAMEKSEALQLLLRFAGRADWASLFATLPQQRGDPAEALDMAAVERLLLDGFVEPEPLLRFNLLLLRCGGYPFLDRELIYRGGVDCLDADAAMEDWVDEDAPHRQEIARVFRQRDPRRWRRNVLSGAL